MKLWFSFLKELKLASRGFYFYVEIGMAAIFLFLLLFVIPENFDSRNDMYLYYDVPDEAFPLFEAELLIDDEDGLSEEVEFELEDKVFLTHHYQTDGFNYYIFDNQDAAIKLADKKRAFAGIISMGQSDIINYTYYLQGYETERLKNVLAVFHNEDVEVLKDNFDAQEVRVLHKDQVMLSDRENVVPSFLTFNGSLMGMFILASYIFLDKKEGVIKAYAVTTSPVWHYLLSKIGVVTITSMITSLLIIIPVLGWQPNYLLMIVFLLSTGLAASSLGLLVSSFYEDISQSFGTIIVLVILMMLPNIAYFIPTWDPVWMQYIPTYSILEGFMEILLPDGNLAYVLFASLGFFIAGVIIFLFANSRFKKTLTV